MNYQTTLKQTYNIDLDGFSSNLGAIALMESGSQIEIDEEEFNDYTYDAFLYTAVNYARRLTNLQDIPVMVLAKTPYNLTLACSTKVDFVDMYATGGSVLSAYGKRENGSYWDIGDGSPLSNYPSYNPNATISSYTYGAYSRSFDYDNNIYDFSSIHGATLTSFRQDSLYIRGENISYYNSYLSFYNVPSTAPLTISYGSPLYELSNESYETGYGNGYASGWVQGQQEGYEQGINSHTDGYTYTAFGYISQAFTAVGGILQLEVLPHITLGLCFSIPLVIVLIMTIFKLVRK